MNKALNIILILVILFAVGYIIFLNINEKNVSSEIPLQDLVCCESFGYGSQMVKCCESYEMVPRTECAIPEGFVGGGKQIVDNSLCSNPQNVVGGDKDEHGCIGTAGYLWCEEKQKCLRPWEEECVPTEQIANPASANCVAMGGEVVIKTLPTGGQYGDCSFEGNRWCEEWALFRGECPQGGIKITGYDNDAQIFCAVRGGNVNMDANTCTTVDGKVCDLEEYYNQTCPVVK